MNWTAGEIVAMVIGWLLVVGIVGWTLAFCDWDDEVEGDESEMAEVISIPTIPTSNDAAQAKGACTPPAEGGVSEARR